MTTKWSHLPNAAHIDAVLASVKANPDEWSAVYNAAWDAARNAALDAARDAARNAAWDAARNAALDAARDAALDAVWIAARGAGWDAALDAVWIAARGAGWDAARIATYNAALGAILALVAYDDCAHMLDSEPNDLRILSKLGSNAATLMIPAAIAFKLIREKQVVVL